MVIVIPFYKAFFLDETLNSLSNQINKNFRVYIGDDCSEEDCSKLVSKYPQLNITYFKFANNLGKTSLVAHWNRCIEMVTDAEWIMILGDDDYLDHNVISDFYTNLNFIDENGFNVIRYSTNVVENNKIILSQKNPMQEDAFSSFLEKFKGKRRSSLSEYVFRFELVKKIGFKHFPLAWHSDDLAVIEFANNKSIYSINSSSINIRISDVSISGNKSNQLQKREATYSFYNYLLTHFSDKLKKQDYFLILNELNFLHKEVKDKISAYSLMKLHMLKISFKWILLGLYRSIFENGKY